MSFRVLCLGAHPDDNEINAGALACKLAARGDKITFVSVTDGCRGHFAPEYLENPAALVSRREAEARAAAAMIGAAYECLGVPDGEVYVNKESTEAMVRCLRRHSPDLVLFNRPLDYHRDHRYTSQLVLDATYMLTVPMFCPDTPHLRRMPVFAYWYDDFADTRPFEAEIAIAMDDVLDTKVSMVAAHASQLFEWLPYNAGVLDQVPPDDAGRRARVEGILKRRGERRYERSKDARLRSSGDFTMAEAFCICEYGRTPGEDELRELFGL